MNTCVYMHIYYDQTTTRNDHMYWLAMITVSHGDHMYRHTMIKLWRDVVRRAYRMRPITTLSP